MTRCRRGCAGRQSNKGKRKFGEELDNKLGRGPLSHLVPEGALAKKQKHPASPKIGDRPIMKMNSAGKIVPKI